MQTALSAIMIILLPDFSVYMSNTAGVLQEVRTAYHSPAHEFIPGFFVGSVLLILIVVCVFTL